MSSQNPYEQLGVTEASSFDEIQDARNRLFTEHEGDRKQLELIEAAYDAVLMDRLRLRQEGKIKVPDRIRFPEKTVQAAPPPAPTAIPSSPGWLQQFIDTPTRTDILLPAAVMAVLAALVVFTPATVAVAQVVQTSLILGTGSCFYFLFRKERKFGRSVLLGVAGMILGLTAGYFLGMALTVPLQSVGLSLDAFEMIVTFFFLWLVSSFLR